MLMNRDPIWIPLLPSGSKRIASTLGAISFRSSMPCAVAVMTLATFVGCQSKPTRSHFPAGSIASQVSSQPLANEEFASEKLASEELGNQAHPIETVAFDAEVDALPFDVMPETNDGLTIESAEAIAIASHPAIAQADAAIQSARGGYVQSRLPFNPLLQYQSDEVGNDESSGLHSVSVSQQFVTANKLGIAGQAEAQRVQQRIAERDIARLKVITAVRASFTSALVAQTRAQISSQLVNIADESVQSVQQLFEAGETSRIEVLQATVEAAQARIAEQNARTELMARRRVLAAAIGIDQLTDESIVGDLAADMTDEPWQDLLDQIVSASPELAAAGSQLERAKWSLSLACAQVTPNVTGQAGVGYDAATDDTFAVVGVSVPLPIRNRNQGNIRSARADVAAASAAIQTTRLSLHRRLADAVGRYQVARQRYFQINETVIPQAEQTFQLSTLAFEAGETGYLQLLTTQRTLFNTRLSVLDALENAKTAMAEIDGYLVSLP